MTKSYRGQIIDILKAESFTITQSNSDISDPFAWSLTAVKDDYEIRIQERSKSLCDS